MIAQLPLIFAPKFKSHMSKGRDWCGKLTWTQLAEFELQRLKFITQRHCWKEKQDHIAQIDRGGEGDVS